MIILFNKGRDILNLSFKTVITYTSSFELTESTEVDRPII